MIIMYDLLVVDGDALVASVNRRYLAIDHIDPTPQRHVSMIQVAVVHAFNSRKKREMVYLFIFLLSNSNTAF